MQQWKWVENKTITPCQIKQENLEQKSSWNEKKKNCSHNLKSLIISYTQKNKKEEERLKKKKHLKHRKWWMWNKKNVVNGENDVVSHYSFIKS